MPRLEQIRERLERLLLAQDTRATAYRGLRWLREAARLEAAQGEGEADS